MTSSLLPTGPKDSFGAETEGLLDPVSSQVRQVLRSTARRPHVADRRREERHPFPHPIYLTPLDRRGSPLPDETVVVLGKHLSDHGIDFYSSQPLSSRRMIASLETAPGRWIGFLLDLLWCRFTRHSWYDNGARILEVTPSPLTWSDERAVARG